MFSNASWIRKEKKRKEKKRKEKKRKEKKEKKRKGLMLLAGTETEKCEVTGELNMYVELNIFM